MTGRRGSEPEEGFSLVELLIVIIIIGILAAIAIPAFISQRQKATDASIKSDLRTIATAIEAQRTSDGELPLTLDKIAADAVTSPGNTFDVVITGTQYCVEGDHPAGVGPSHTWVYDTAAGGMSKTEGAACSGTPAFSIS